MSVSLQDTHVFTSSNPDHAHGNAKAEQAASRSAPAALSFNGGNVATVSFQFNAHQAGPMYGDQYSPTDGHRHAHQHGHHQSGPEMQSFVQQFQNLLTQWFGANRSPRPDTSIGNPYPQAPRKHDSQYSAKSSQELTTQLRNNFAALQNPMLPGYVSAQSILDTAQRGWSFNSAANHNTRLANELLRRPDLMKIFDRSGPDGRLDGLISLQDLDAVINGTNPFKLTPDTQLAAELLTHFDALNGGRYGQDLTFDNLRQMAGQSLAGNPPMAHVIQLAQEALKRADVLNAIDTTIKGFPDSRISREALRMLAS